jgi:ribonuclease P/MRP protein subunit POP3
LTPIGEYHRSLEPSKGKRARKRKRQDASIQDETVAAETEPSRPPPPEIAKYVDVGLASISRNLERASQEPVTTLIPSTDGYQPYAVVFVARHGQDTAFHCHFPQMTAVASQAQHPMPPIRLVGFSSSCSDRLSSCLGIPRVSSIGIRNGAACVGGKTLLDFVVSHVPSTEVAWLEEAHNGEYREVKIDTILTKAGPKLARASQGKAILEKKSA